MPGWSAAEAERDPGLSALDVLSAQFHNWPPDCAALHPGYTSAYRLDPGNSAKNKTPGRRGGRRDLRRFLHEHRRPQRLLRQTEVVVR